MFDHFGPFMTSLSVKYVLPKTQFNFVPLKRQNPYYFSRLPVPAWPGLYLAKMGIAYIHCMFTGLAMLKYRSMNMGLSRIFLFFIHPV